MTIVSSAWFLFLDSPKEKPKIPFISVGCDRVSWNDEELEFKPTIQNIDNPEKIRFQWFLDKQDIGKSRNIKYKFNNTGIYNISLRVNFNDKNNKSSATLTDKLVIIVIDSIGRSVSIKDSQEEKNSWKFQTIYNKKDVGVNKVEIYIDSLPKKYVNPCGYISVPLFAGDHTWRAEYRGEKIGSGNFTLKEVTEIKVDRIDIKPSYKVGDIVQGKITIENTGTTEIKSFEIKTLAVNEKYKWMGDVAKREYYNKYENLQFNPGDKFDILIEVKIPEKVKGIAPTGRYSMTTNLILNGKTINSKTINTEVKS